MRKRNKNKTGIRKRFKVLKVQLGAIQPFLGTKNDRFSSRIYISSFNLFEKFFETGTEKSTLSKVSL